MKILFDHRTPAPLREHFRDQSVGRSQEGVWGLPEDG